MDIAALVVAALAAGFAGFSWYEARRSSRAAEKSAQEASAVRRIESERRHEERQPEWSISGSEKEYDLVEFELLVEGPAERYGVSVEVIDGSVVPAIRTSVSGAVSNKVLDLDDVSVGAPVRFLGNTIKGTDGKQRFLVKFRFDGATWTLYRDCKITWAPRVL